MFRFMPGNTKTVQYKSQEFHKIPQQFRFGVAAPTPTLLFINDMPRHQRKAAAKNMALKLGKQLYQVDLKSINSKYIGETEKNLSRLFNNVSKSNHILFFDEADALFGKRTDVKDTHDRYANQEVNHLLQKLERHKGLIILTTNSKSGITRKVGRWPKVIIRYPPK